LIQLPNNSQRLALVGRTGSGKTQAAVWHLSKRNLQSFPWIILNWKEDDLINSIPYASHIEVNNNLRSVRNGVFIVTPTPNQTEEVDALLWRIWNKEDIGVMVDEGYMIGSSDAFNACLTQGRAKRIPMIVCSQRPVWMSRFVWSESDFIQAFDLTVDDDKDTIQKYAPIDLYRNIPAFWSWYYDVGKKKRNLLKPVPESEEILSAIENKLRKVYRKI
jgi:hypothetical protein